MIKKFDILKKYSTWVLKLSGGADSALILYYMNKIRTNEDLWILTGVNDNDQNYDGHARDVIQFLQVKNATHILYPQTHKTGDEKLILDHSFYDKIACVFEPGSTIGVQGRTLNPPFHIDGEEENRNGDSPMIEHINGHVLYRPWYDVDKKQIVKAYREENLMTLFSMTRSCVSLTEEKCGRCFWCKEREWALKS